MGLVDGGLDLSGAQIPQLDAPIVERHGQGFPIGRDGQRPDRSGLAIEKEPGLRTGIFLVSTLADYGPVCQFGQLAKKQQTIEAQQDHSDDRTVSSPPIATVARQAAVRPML